MPTPHAEFTVHLHGPPNAGKTALLMLLFKQAREHPEVRTAPSPELAAQLERENVEREYDRTDPRLDPVAGEGADDTGEHVRFWLDRDYSCKVVSHGGEELRNAGGSYDPLLLEQQFVADEQRRMLVAVFNPVLYPLPDTPPERSLAYQALLHHMGEFQRLNPGLGFRDALLHAAGLLLHHDERGLQELVGADFYRKMLPPPEKVAHVKREYGAHFEFVNMTPDEQQNAERLLREIAGKVASENRNPHFVCIRTAVRNLLAAGRRVGVVLTHEDLAERVPEWSRHQREIFHHLFGGPFGEARQRSVVASRVVRWDLGEEPKAPVPGGPSPTQGKDPPDRGAADLWEAVCSYARAARPAPLPPAPPPEEVRADTDADLAAPGECAREGLYAFALSLPWLLGVVLAFALVRLLARRPPALMEESLTFLGVLALAALGGCLGFAFWRVDRLPPRWRVRKSPGGCRLFLGHGFGPAAVEVPGEKVAIQTSALGRWLNQGRLITDDGRRFAAPRLRQLLELLRPSADRHVTAPAETLTVLLAVVLAAALAVRVLW